jgi:GMP synthase-like glutamine amidotransferase
VTLFPAQARIAARRPTLLVCAGLQILADSSEESPGVAGLGSIRVPVVRFAKHLRCPQQAWSLVTPADDRDDGFVPRGHAFYSNSYCITATPIGWRAALSTHGDTTYVAALQAGGVLALQFHPELSASYGKEVIARWVAGSAAATPQPSLAAPSARSLCRVICCMDIRDGRVVKGVNFQNLVDAGDPVAQAEVYQQQGADELVILDVSATVEGRSHASEVVRAVRGRVSLPITVGGGVRTVADAAALLDAGADKVLTLLPLVSSRLFCFPFFLVCALHKSLGIRQSCFSIEVFKAGVEKCCVCVCVCATMRVLVFLGVLRGSSQKPLPFLALISSSHLHKGGG